MYSRPTKAGYKSIPNTSAADERRSTPISHLFLIRVYLRSSAAIRRKVFSHPAASARLTRYPRKFDELVR
jgi:hypothetical protein